MGRSKWRRATLAIAFLLALEIVIPCNSAVVKKVRRRVKSVKLQQSAAETSENVSPQMQSQSPEQLLTQSTAGGPLQDLYGPTEPPYPSYPLDDRPLPPDQNFINRMEDLLPVNEPASNRYVRQIEEAPPRPYSFGYLARDPVDGGSHSRSEAGDSTGRVVGYYTLRSPEGYTRRVNYIADERGFRAEVLTNEPGTANQSPANAIVRSTAVQPFPNRFTPPGSGESASASASASASSSSAAAAAASYNLPSRTIFPDPRKRVLKVPRGYRAVFIPLD